MIYTLMHKRIPIAELELDNTVCVIIGINKIITPEHFPIGILSKNNQANKLSLTRWWRRRAIPASRDGLRQALDEMDIPLPEILLEKCYGLSLSDQYCVCPKNRDLRWEDINFFDNPFLEAVRPLFIDEQGEINAIELIDKK